MKYQVTSKALSKLRLNALKKGLSVATLTTDELVAHYPHGATMDGVTETETNTIEVPTPSKPTPTPGKPATPGQHKVFPLLLATLKAGVDVALVGPAGSGKTTIAMNVARKLERDFHFNGTTLQEHKLTGFIDANGKHTGSQLHSAFQSKSALYLADEMDSWSPVATLAMNMATANREMDFPNGALKANDLTFIAAMNTYGNGADREYVGRNQLDAATLDRFAIIDMDYDEDLERAISTRPDWCARVHRVRAATRKLKLRHVVSMRAIIKGEQLLTSGLDQPAVEQMLLWKSLDSATIAKINAEAV